VVGPDMNSNLRLITLDISTILHQRGGHNTKQYNYNGYLLDL